MLAGLLGSVTFTMTGTHIIPAPGAVVLSAAAGCGGAAILFCGNGAKGVGVVTFDPSTTGNGAKGVGVLTSAPGTGGTAPGTIGATGTGATGAAAPGAGATGAGAAAAGAGAGAPGAAVAPGAGVSPGLLLITITLSRSACCDGVNT